MENTIPRPGQTIANLYVVDKARRDEERGGYIASCHVNYGELGTEYVVLFVSDYSMYHDVISNSRDPHEAEYHYQVGGVCECGGRIVRRQCVKCRIHKILPITLD